MRIGAGNAHLPRRSATVMERRKESTDTRRSEEDGSDVYTIFQSLKPNYTITKGESLPLYYITTPGLNPSTPHLTMYRGKDSSGPPVAFVRFMRTSWSAKLARGDPNDAQNAIWEDMRRVDKWAGVKYRWEMAVVDETGNVERKAFIWKRTRAVNIERPPGQWRKLSNQNYKLVDERTGELLAAFSLDHGLTNLRRLGKVRLMSDKYGDVFRMMVFLSALSMRDWEE